jgi:hypothetical protein
VVQAHTLPLVRPFVLPFPFLSAVCPCLCLFLLLGWIATGSSSHSAANTDPDKQATTTATAATCSGRNSNRATQWKKMGRFAQILAEIETLLEKMWARMRRDKPQCGRKTISAGALPTLK